MCCPYQSWLLQCTKGFQPPHAYKQVLAAFLRGARFDFHWNWRYLSQPLSPSILNYELPQAASIHSPPANIPILQTEKNARKAQLLSFPSWPPSAEDKILGQQVLAVRSEFCQLNEMRKTKRCLQMRTSMPMESWTQRNGRTTRWGAKRHVFKSLLYPVSLPSTKCGRTVAH